MQTIYISVTVDWEGDHFDNLGDLERLRLGIAQLGFDVPYTHYICPNYWLKKLADSKSQPIDVSKLLTATKAIDWAQDEIGLHVHCWQPLVEAAGVKYQNVPTWSPNSSQVDATGHGVPLGSYTTADVTQIVSTAKGLLEQKLPNAKPVGGFRCGGWMSNDAVLRSLMSIEFAYDCSAVPPAVFSYGYDRKSQGSGKDTYGDKNGITPFILELWGYDAAKQAYAANSLSLKWNIGNAILPTTQPYKIFEGSASLIQMPNNAGLSDYSVAQFMTGCLADLQQLALHHDEPLFLNIGCHQEGGSAYKNPLFKFFDANATVLQKAMANEEIVFTTVADAARVADLYMVD